MYFSFPKMTMQIFFSFSVLNLKQQAKNTFLSLFCNKTYSSQGNWEDHWESWANGARMVINTHGLMSKTTIN